MKSIKFFFACVLALTFVACSNAESDSFEDNTSNFESMKSLYGIESAAYDPKAEEIPSVTAEEMADRKSTRLNSSHPNPSRMPSSA